MKKLLIASVLALLICVSTAKADAESYSVMFIRVHKLEKRIDELEETIDSLSRQINAHRLETKFYKGQTVYDVVRGKGVVVHIDSDDFPHPVWVKFPHIKIECLYTKDGKWFSFDSSPSLYDKEMKVVPK